MARCKDLRSPGKSLVKGVDSAKNGKSAPWAFISRNATLFPVSDDRIRRKEVQQYGEGKG